MSTKVIGTIVSLLFGVPGLTWEKDLFHLEVFAGQSEVTKAELEALACKLLKVMETEFEQGICHRN